jgi:membrane-bound lytic murein transglycosylase B
LADRHPRGIALVAGVLLLVVGTVLVANFASARTVTTPVDYQIPAYAGAAPATSGSPVSQAWIDATAAKAGIPAVAMNAYARAQLSAPCTIGWTTLAGIGWVESQNGTIGGRTLGADGLPSRPIRGPRLKGGLDRAYGPMQIIPSTWARYATDGDGDGTADPQDIFDAAAAAADYLCATDQDLATASGWASAVFSYNHSQDYVDAVYAAASTYDQRTR